MQCATLRFNRDCRLRALDRLILQILFRDTWCLESDTYFGQPRDSFSVHKCFLSRCQADRKGGCTKLGIQQLEEMLRERGLEVTGSKAELIARLLQVDPDVEKSLPSGSGATETTAQTEVPTMASTENPTAESGTASQILMQTMEMMRTEMRAMRCEHEAQRERGQETPRERDIQRDREVQFTLPSANTAGALSMHPTIGIKTFIIGSSNWNYCETAWTIIVLEL